jgi:hypothetical protein
LELLTGRAGLALGRRAPDAQHRPELELSGSPDDLDRLVRVGDPGQLDDDPTAPGTLQRGLRQTEGVDPSPQHFQRARHDIPVDLDPVGVAGLQDDLGASLQVQPQPDRPGERERGGTDHGHEDREGAPPRRTRHVGFLPALPATSRRRSRDGELELGRGATADR